MKSVFFGLNAKLALAVLAVGTMFTSCYDSENGDVTRPYEAPDAVYTITGTVTNNITGQGVDGARVAISGALTGEATTDETGTYQYTTTVDGGVAGDVTLTVTGSDFEETSATVAVSQIANGQSVIYFKNVIVNYTAYLPEGLEITTSNNTSTEETNISGADGTENTTPMDIINDTEESLSVDLKFSVLNGSRIYEDIENVMGQGAISRAISDEAKADVKAWILGDLGIADGNITAEFARKSILQTVVIPPLMALNNVSIDYTVETKNFNYTYGTEAGRVVTQTILSVVFTPETVDISHYHGHGHGHGNGENAGGGILAPEF